MTTPLQAALRNVRRQAVADLETVAPEDWAVLHALDTLRMIRSKASLAGDPADLVAGASDWLLQTVMGVHPLHLAPLEVQALVEAARQLTLEGRLLPPREKS